MNHSLMEALSHRRFLVLGVSILVVILSLRVSTLDALDLIDPTEGRYAWVAQEMVSSGDWLTPKLPQPSGVVPYLGKPPLHFWMTAISYRLFGVHECTSRLPSFVSYLAIVFFVALFAKRFFGGAVALLSALVVVSSGLLFFLSGASVVDVTLTACITGAIVSFAFCIESLSKTLQWRWGCLFYAMAALSVLAKGPVGLVLIGFPLFLWMLFEKRFQDLRKLPWISGAIVFLGIVIPWFLLEESAQPGFLRYFLLNENFGRYLVHDYGDRYGSGHVYFRGSSWWMLLVSAFPWSVLWLLTFLQSPRAAFTTFKTGSPWIRYAILWGVTPAIFFTFVRQLQAAYILPGMGGLAICTSVLIHSLNNSSRRVIVDNFSRAVCLVSILIAGVGISLGVLLGSHFLSMLAALFLFVCMVWTVAKVKNSHLHLAESSAVASGVMTAAFTVVVLSMASYVSERKSTEAILREVTETVRAKSVTVGVIQSNAYSSYFYGRTWQNEFTKPVNIAFVDASDPTHVGPRYLIGRTKELTGGYASFLEHYKMRKSLGRWAWFERRKSFLNTRSHQHASLMKESSKKT